MTETGHGSNVQALGTIATYDAGRGRVRDHDDRRPDASKDYIGNAAAHGELAVVFAQLDVGRRAARRARASWCRSATRRASPLPGVRIEDDGLKIGLNGVDNGRLWFDRVRVPREALLNRYADVAEDGTYTSRIENPNRRFFTMLGTLVQGRVCVGGAGINASKVALADRDPLRAEAPPVRATSERRGGAAARLRPAPAPAASRCSPRPTRCTSRRRSWPAELHTGCSPARWATTTASAASSSRGRRAPRRSATWHATRTIQECREACGGAGYLAANRFAALKADTDVFTTFEGDNTVLLQLVAKGLLTDYASEFGDLDQLGMVRFVAGLAVETVVERTSVHKLLERVRDLLPGGDQWDQEAGLLDPAYQLAMLRFREEHMLGGVARRLKRGIDAGMNPVEVFSRVPGPRHRTRPARTSSGWCWRRSSTRSRRWRTATTRSPWACSATCTRCRPSRPTGPGSWSTAG